MLSASRVDRVLVLSVGRVGSIDSAVVADKSGALFYFSPCFIFALFYF